MGDSRMSRPESLAVEASEVDTDTDARREVSVTDDRDVDILPDQTSDDSPDWSELRDEDHEVRLFEDRPPHWEN